MRPFLMIAVLLGSFAVVFADDTVTGATNIVTGATNVVTDATNAATDATNAVTASLAAAVPAAQTGAAAGHVLKVLPLFLDLKGHDAVSPSLFDRDAYQAHLRQHTNAVSAIRFDVLWKASNLKGTKLKLRAEMRGVGERGLPRQTVLEKEVTPAFFRSWTSLKLEDDELKNLGSLIAWRVTLWNGDQLLGEQKSFLW